MLMKKQMMNIYQPTTLCAKFFHCHEPMLAEDLPACASAVVHTCTNLQLTHEALDYDSHHILTPRLTTATPGGFGN